MCGEKAFVRFQPFLCPGSPPRVRGKGDCALPRQAAKRITPACAGKRLLTWRFLPAARDHPRVCGEKPSSQMSRKTHGGSPPRVRGKVWDSVFFVVLKRITPACAGKRLSLHSSSALSEDHPRVCGEKLLRPGLRGGNWGSPPRVRGKVKRGELLSDVVRITPACAGKSQRCHNP